MRGTPVWPVAGIGHIHRRARATRVDARVSTAIHVEVHGVRNALGWVLLGGVGVRGGGNVLADIPIGDWN